MSLRPSSRTPSRPDPGAPSVRCRAWRHAARHPWPGGRYVPPVSHTPCRRAAWPGGIEAVRVGHMGRRPAGWRRSAAPRASSHGRWRRRAGPRAGPRCGPPRGGTCCLAYPDRPGSARSAHRRAWPGRSGYPGSLGTNRSPLHRQVSSTASRGGAARRLPLASPGDAANTSSRSRSPVPGAAAATALPSAGRTRCH
jgi:hypothetical protein